MKRIALTACSDPIAKKRRPEIRQLEELLQAEGLQVIEGPGLFEENVFAGKCKADALNALFRDPETDGIFDISGGDLANSVLPYLDYDMIRGSRAKLFGYSDLTCVLNAVTARAGIETVNYQIRNLLYDHAGEQLAYFRSCILTDRNGPEELGIRFLRGAQMQGKILGGNVRCFLKLAGTPYWPQMKGNILLLESLGGGAARMITSLQQYIQMGVFDQLSGVLLGTFTKMERERITPSIEEIILRIVPEGIPVACTRLIGHGTDARAVVLGREVRIGASS